MEHWQSFVARPARLGAWTERYAAPMPDGSALMLPLRDLGDTAVAGLIANQASFAIAERLAAWMTELARPFEAEVVVGLPTLGQVFAPAIARALGHPNWVAPGWSRKRWYEERLSVAAQSITSPGERRLWLDPRLLPRLAGRRVLLVDDVISTGASARAGLDLLAAAGTVPVALLVAMAQGDRWRRDWREEVPVRAVFATPIFARDSAGWVPVPGSAPHDVCPLFEDPAA
ncbi:phosphoribosyltransferase [Falsiroseomonas oryziterrae]|uniref:phosphoribosyltransferase n=1 Tax=Falsiroseomonas oryziterrae TaxID=2911368 RepID=UPI001F01373A|nr:phosphoribosyltransferase [Roseomonas sp. NPKOSM-4]